MLVWDDLPAIFLDRLIYILPRGNIVGAPFAFVPSADAPTVDIDPTTIPSVPDIPNRTASFSRYNEVRVRHNSCTAIAALAPFDSRYRAILYHGLVNKYLSDGYTEDAAFAMATSTLLSDDAVSLLHYISTYNNLSTPSISTDIVDLSYVFHSSKLSSFSDYTVGRFPWEYFYTEIQHTVPSTALSPFLLDPVIFNSYTGTGLSNNLVAIGSLSNPYVFLIDLGDLSVKDAARVPNSEIVYAWSLSSDKVLIIGLQAYVSEYDLTVNPSRKNYGTRLSVVSVSTNSFGSGNTYVFPASSVVGFDIIDGIPYAATSFCNGNTQYTSIISTPTREILFREELDLPSLLGVDPSNTRVSMFTGVRFFKHKDYMLAAIVHSHTLCTGETKNLVTVCRYDSSIDSAASNFATYYSCRYRQFVLPEGYYSTIPLFAVNVDEGTTNLFLSGYTSEDLIHA